MNSYILFDYFSFSIVFKWILPLAYLIFVCLKLVNGYKNHKNQLKEIENRHGKNLEKINVDLYSRGMKNSGIGDKTYLEERERFDMEKIKEKRNYYDKFIDSILLK